MDPLRPSDPRRVGKYQLVGRLGEGGMGQVFFGRSPGGRPVAVKLIRYEYAHRERFRARFAREVEAARRVGGFHTTLVVDADPGADPPWMATAYIPGPSLHGAVTEHGPLATRAVRTLGAGLAEGLAAIHACGLVHRDLKPGNVILAADGPRIIDFGIASAQDASRMTATGAVLGTYAYMSPEQVNGHPPEAAGDVFALGAVLGFAATGRSPFDAESIPAILRRIAGEQPDLGDVAVEGELRELIVACLAKDPAARPPLADVLDRLAGPWPSADWLPPAVMDMIASTESESACALASEAEAPGHGPHGLHGMHGMHGQTTVESAAADPDPGPGPGPGPGESTSGEPASGNPASGRGIPRRAVLLTGLVACLVAVVTGATLLVPPDSDEPSADSKRIVTDDGRAFGPGGWSQFEVTVDPDNTGVRLTRRLDSSVSGQRASISVNGERAGFWEPLGRALTRWADQTVELSKSSTKGRRTLTIRNTFESSTKDFNEFTYFVDHKIDGAWRRADVVDIGPGHRAEEKAHGYRIKRKAWEGTRSFSYRRG
ncbi:serine/threonine-protein kinase [Streptomyces winkii]|uniref:serine/threonine-protein kinase n=1 Tax=Streptomyces winkii TaxID=3051178 RepID=UPI0028D3C768|nr:serine/threonine-protein kinase [Streptomyces sp. DSM 40971]